MLRRHSKSKKITERQFNQFRDDIEDGNVAAVKAMVEKYRSNYAVMKQISTIVPSLIGDIRMPHQPEELRNGRQQILEILLGAGALSTGSPGLLHDALAIDHFQWESDIVKRQTIAKAVYALLRRKDLKKNVYQDGITPLIRAIRNGYDECTRLLIADMEVDVNAPMNADIKSHGAPDSTQYGLTPLMFAAGIKRLKGFDDLGELLLARRDIDVNRKTADGDTALARALRSGDSELAVKILQHKKFSGVNELMADSETYLSLAIAGHMNDVVDALLQRSDLNVNLQNGRGRSPLMIAVSRNPQAARKLLARTDIDTELVDKNGWTVFNWAISDVEMLDLLLQRPQTDAAAINHRDKNGDTLLSHTLIRGSSDDAAMHLLATGKVELDLKDELGQSTALIYASRNASRDHHNVAMKLIELGADVKAADSDGVDALMQAVISEDLGLARALLEKGADPTRRNDNKDSALEIAIENVDEGKDLEFADLLVKHGANLAYKHEVSGKLPCELAVSTGNMPLTLRLLRLESEAQKLSPVRAFSMFRSPDFNPGTMPAQPSNTPAP